MKSLKEGVGQEPRRCGRRKAKARLMKSMGWQVMRFSWRGNINYQKMPAEKRKEFWTSNLGKFGVLV